MAIGDLRGVAANSGNARCAGWGGAVVAMAVVAAVEVAAAAVAALEWAQCAKRAERAVKL